MQPRGTPLHNCGERQGRPAPQCAFPNSGHPPATLEKRGFGRRIPKLVAIDFLPPELAPCAWKAKQRTVVSVPEAAMDKDDSTIFGEHQIWGSAKFPVVKSEAKSPGVQFPPKSQLRFSVLGPDPGHHQAALLARDYVDH